MSLQKHNFVSPLRHHLYRPKEPSSAPSYAREQGRPPAEASEENPSWQ